MDEDFKVGICGAKAGTMLGKGTYSSLFKAKLEPGKHIPAEDAAGKRNTDVGTGEPVVVAVKEYSFSTPKASMGDEDVESLQVDNLMTLRSEMEDKLTTGDLLHPNLAHYFGFEYAHTKLSGGAHRCLLTIDWIETGGKKTKGPMPEKLVQHIARGLLSGIAHLHSNGITHDDIRPANVMLTHNWPCAGELQKDADGSELPHVVVTDYAVFKKVQLMLDPAGGNATTKQKAQYLAPEVFTDGNDYDPFKADSWGCGATLLELFSGKVPYHEMDPTGRGNVMFKIIQSKNPPKYPDSCSAEAKSFFDAVFERNFDDRPAPEDLLNHPWVMGGGGASAE